MNRRDFLTTGGAAFLTTRVGRLNQAYALPLPGGPLNPAGLTKYVTPLVIPPAMPETKILPGLGGKGNDFYRIAVRQFNQQILPAGSPQTTVWSYGSIDEPSTFNYPAFTIEANYQRPVRVQWINGLVDRRRRYLPHLLPVDQTLHWANPPGPVDTRGTNPNSYTGPVPIVTHVHGAHTNDESDGYPEAWYLPLASNIPHSYKRVGSQYAAFAIQSLFKGIVWLPGTATFQYPNDQNATTLWYHDHSLGLTRVNVYAGPAGFFLLRGGPTDLPSGVLPGPAPGQDDAPGTKYYEIPIVIQDRAFNHDGSLFYPDSRFFFDEFGGPYIPNPASDISPIWNPEFFGNTMVVNGNTWPKLNVERRRYRFRLLNGCNSRFLNLKMVTGNPAERPATAALPFWQIGAEGGFLPAPVSLSRLLIAPAERADVIVDFSSVPVGTEVYLINEGPDEPFGGGEPGHEFEWADPDTTGQVMKFVVGPVSGVDISIPPTSLTLPSIPALGPHTVTRKLSLNEEMSMLLSGEGPRAAVLGTVDAVGNPQGKMWGDPITEQPKRGTTELWELYNFTADAHPIHVHQVQFQVVDRQPLQTDAEGVSTAPATLNGPPRSPESWETGYKDTVIAYPGEVTRLKARFDLAGLFVWHCHIIEHEDNEMMRPLRVKP